MHQRLLHTYEDPKSDKHAQQQSDCCQLNAQENAIGSHKNVSPMYR